MELMSIGFLAGVVVVLVVLMIGVIRNDGTDKREHDNNSNVPVNIPSRDRDRSGDNRYVEQLDAEEVINGLRVIKMGLSRQEQDYIDYSVNCVLKIQKLQRMIDEGRFGNGD